MNFTVSVILPTYNRSQSLKAASESVLSQSFRNLELIIVDDASSEDIMSIVESLNDDRVRYVRHENNEGASTARNTGLALAKGDFFAFQDSDDLWLPGKLAKQLALFEKLPEEVGVVFGSKILYGRDSEHNYGPGKVTCAPPPQRCLKLTEDQVKRFLEENRISLQNAMFRRNCFPNIRWFDPCAKANADWEFTSRLAQHTLIYEDTEPVVVAFISEDSISKNPRKKGLGLIRIIKKNKSVLETYPDTYAKNLFSLSGIMWRLGKRKTARGILLLSVRKHLRTSLSLAVQKFIKLLRSRVSLFLFRA